MEEQLFDPFALVSNLDQEEGDESYDTERMPLESWAYRPWQWYEFTSRYDNWLPNEAAQRWRAMLESMDRDEAYSVDKQQVIAAWQEQELALIRSLSGAGKSKKPCVFVSYRSLDRPMALQLAYYLMRRGKAVWLDVWDPRIARTHGLRLPPAMHSRVVALMIEIALLQCTHLTVVHTPNTKTSVWVPYELGRVKSPTVTASNASFWHGTYRLPGYAHLVPCFERVRDRKRFARWVSAI